MRTEQKRQLAWGLLLATLAIPMGCSHQTTPFQEDEPVASDQKNENSESSDSHPSQTPSEDKNDSGGQNDDESSDGLVPQNLPPIADAGEDSQYYPGEQVQLDGTASMDPEGQPLEFRWRIISNPLTLSLIGGLTGHPRFLAPEVATRSTILFELEVSDGLFFSTDRVQVEIVPESNPNDDQILPPDSSNDNSNDDLPPEDNQQNGNDNQNQNDHDPGQQNNNQNDNSSQDQQEDPCPFGNDLQNYATCDIQIVLQRKYSDFDYSDLGVQNAGTVLNGHFFLAGTDTTLDQFIRATEEEIESSLRYWLARSDIDLNTTDLMVIDIERPEYIPRNWWTYEDDPDLQQAIFDAFKIRVAVARRVLPYCRLSLFNIVAAPVQGQKNRTLMENMMRGYRAAGAYGVYDQLDNISPILMMAFDPREEGYAMLESRMRMGIENAQTLTRTDGSTLPLAVHLSFLIIHGHSDYDHQPADINGIRRQIEICQEYPSVTTVYLWDGEDEEYHRPMLEQIKPTPAACFCNP